ncbi:DUF2946 family protein [Cohaesibacter marisflavi]|uniref:DUF2946 family protein n=1 Tax=Cohaesibacter marisflavi TaxID=655353 RepID=UPI0011145A2E|nr:DUF2946 family protein [Cohaesibacter marisflavi]
MNQNPTLFRRLHSQRAITLLALCAMWLQVLAFGIHLSTSAEAAAGTSGDDMYFGIICTANGLAAVSFDGEETPATLEKDCAICALTALHDLGFNNHTQPCERPVHSIRTVFWPTAPSDGTLSLSPRVGTSRAPPLL